MKKLLAFIFTAVLFLFSSCKFGFYPLAFTDQNVDDRVKSIKKLEDSCLPSGTNGNSTYSFILVTDIHLGADRYNHHHDNFFAWLENQFNSEDASKRPQFMVNLGDTADSGSEAQFKEFLTWAEKVKQLAAKGKDGIKDFKIYSITGNHDLYNDGQDYFQDYMFPHVYSYYFDFANDKSTEGFEFFFLDSGNGSLGTHQMEDFEDKIDDSKKPKIILTHYPVYAGGVLLTTMQDTLETAKIITLASENNTRLILEGHAHREGSCDYGDMYEEITPSYGNNNKINLITVNEKTGACSTNIIKY